jgi:hypothetical protein
MARAIAIFLSLIISANSFAQTKGAMCSRVFSDADEKYELNQQVLKLVREHFNIKKDNGSWIASWLLRRATNKMDLKNFSYQYDYELSVLDAYRTIEFTKNLLAGAAPFPVTAKEELDWVQRTLFFRGLQPYIDNYRQIVEAEKRNSVLFRIEKIMSHRVFAYLAFPTAPPNFKDHQIPPALLAKISLEGAERHRQELNRVYHTSGQDLLDDYRNFSTVYKLIIMIVGAYLLSEQMDKMRDVSRKTVKDDFVEDLDRLDADLDALDRALEKQGFYKNGPGSKRSPEKPKVSSALLSG